MNDTPIVGVVGVGVTGSFLADHVVARGHRVALFDRNRGAAGAVAARVGGVVVDHHSDLAAADVVVLAHAGPHATLAAELLSSGVAVVSVNDQLDDVRALLGLSGLAANHGVPLVVGAALSPGLSGLLAARLAKQLAVVDEIHVAVHGTGGPACARQHHEALGSRAIGWHDRAWTYHPGGSGRELCWFPEPVGSHDCYRAALADPVTLQAAFPTVGRISARVSATRRDRMTARLPMLAPPHKGGDLGAVRVEVRGALADGSRETVIAGTSGPTGRLAAIVAAAATMCVIADAWAPGAHALGAEPIATELLAQVLTFGLTLQEFTGVARPTAW